MRKLTEKQRQARENARLFYKDLKIERQKMIIYAENNKYAMKIADMIKEKEQYGYNNCKWLAAQIAEKYMNIKTGKITDSMYSSPDDYLQSLKLNFTTAYQMRDYASSKGVPYYYILGPHKVYHFSFYKVYDIGEVMRYNNIEETAA